MTNPVVPNGQCRRYRSDFENSRNIDKSIIIEDGMHCIETPGIPLKEYRTEG
jgi:hypothetical protein